MDGCLCILVFWPTEGPCLLLLSFVVRKRMREIKMDCEVNENWKFWFLSGGRTSIFIEEVLFWNLHKARRLMSKEFLSLNCKCRFSKRWVNWLIFVETGFDTDGFWFLSSDRFWLSWRAWSGWHAQTIFGKKLSFEYLSWAKFLVKRNFFRSNYFYFSYCNFAAQTIFL